MDDDEACRDIPDGRFLGRAPCDGGDVSAGRWSSRKYVRRPRKDPVALFVRPECDRLSDQNANGFWRRAIVPEWRAVERTVSIEAKPEGAGAKGDAGAVRTGIAKRKNPLKVFRSTVCRHDPSRKSHLRRYLRRHPRPSVPVLDVRRRRSRRRRSARLSQQESGNGCENDVTQTNGIVHIRGGCFSSE
jgi:ribosomal protein S9